MSSSDADEALLQQAADRARALVATLGADADALKGHRDREQLAGGITLCERASRDATELLAPLEAALQRRADHSSTSQPETNPS